MVMTNEEMLAQLDPTYRDWFLALLEKNPEFKSPEKYDRLLYEIYKSDFDDKQRIKKTTGYIGVQKVSFVKNIGSWTLPVCKEDPLATLYLLHKDRISFTRNVDEALLIEGNRGRDRVEIDFVTNGYRYRFIPKDQVKDWLGSLPLPRKAIKKADRLLTYQKFNGRCAYCGCEIKYEEMEVDHFVSHMSNMGEDDISNYMPACHDCNHVKVDYTITQFKHAIQHCGEIHRARKKPIMAISDRIAIKYGLTEQDHEITFLYEKEKSDVSK